MHHEFTTIQELLVYVSQTTGKDPKGICEFGKVSPDLAMRIEQLVGLNTNGCRLTLDSYGIRHAFGGHSQERGSRDKFPLTAADVLTLPNWLAAPSTLLPGSAPGNSNQSQRLQAIHSDKQATAETIVIMEVHPRFGRLVLVTMYKRKNG